MFNKILRTNLMYRIGNKYNLIDNINNQTISLQILSSSLIILYIFAYLKHKYISRILIIRNFFLNWLFV